LHERDNRERQLQTENDLAEDQQLARFRLTMSSVTPAAGMMAMARVIRRRSQPGRRISRKPSITACPARVAVTVELSPQQSSASPNRIGAKDEPSSGANSACACPNSTTSVWPAL